MRTPGSVALLVSISVLGGCGGATTAEERSSPSGECGSARPSCADAPECAGEDCCSAALVSGGRYDRGLPEYEVTVDDFCMDKFEITVGRFREFIHAYDAWIGDGHPAGGEGEHVAGYGSGWQPEWNPGEELPADASTFAADLRCDPGLETWTDAPTEADNRPVNCLSWYEAFAFCIWDGGRLPTEAEWEYAAAHGEQRRTYPWGNTPEPDNTRAVFNCQWDGDPGSCVAADLAPVASTPNGVGYWGQTDLGGSMSEWVFDFYGLDYPLACDNCANITPEDERVTRGGSFYSEYEYLVTWYRGPFAPERRHRGSGARCVRAVP
jgi:formylglycine-generating enzyme